MKFAALFLVFAVLVVPCQAQSIGLDLLDGTPAEVITEPPLAIFTEPTAVLNEMPATPVRTAVRATRYAVPAVLRAQPIRRTLRLFRGRVGRVLGCGA